MKESAMKSYLMAVQSSKCRGSLVLRQVQTVAVRRGQVVIPKSRSKTVIVADENPVERYCDRRYQLVKEVLMMSGIVWRTEKRQLPIIDSRRRDSIRNLYGSIRNLRVDGRRLVGEVAWASDEQAQEIARKWQDGHLSDFSVTAVPIEVMEVGAGQTWRSIQGPANFVTKWQPIDVSIVCSDSSWSAGGD